MSILGRLDATQKSAAVSESRWIRVMAGAGTGKTTTLTGRIEHLLGSVSPDAVMAVTFTNKAAKEIRERVEHSVPAASGILMGTFHAISVRILRRYAEAAGLRDSNFVIVDDDESKELISFAIDASGAYAPFEEPSADGLSKAEHKDIVKAEKKVYDSMRKEFWKDCCDRIGRWKDAGLTVDIVQNPDRERRDAHEECIASVYESYQAELEKRNACDFADLVMRVVTMFDRHPDIAKQCAGRFKHVLVDEFQDTNLMQARWVRHMVSHGSSLFVVGDIDQSVYGWRGACPKTMENMNTKNLHDVVLEVNRRCTEQILAPANLIVDYNTRAVPKTLRSGRNGDSVSVKAFQNEFVEASYIAKSVKGFIQRGTPAKEIACLYRSRSPYLTKPLEKAFVREGIKYVLIGGTSLMEREEIKDCLAYLRVAADPHNDLPFRRIVNKPLRGLGPAAADAICGIASATGLPLHESCITFVSDSKSGRVKQEAKDSCSELGGLLQEMSDAVRRGVPPNAILEMALSRTGYERWLMEKQEEDYRDRLANIQFLINLSASYGDVFEFLQNVVLMTDEDGSAPDEEAVRISTVHASKGLEYDVVFCPAFEDKVFPNPKAVAEGGKGDFSDPWNPPVSGGLDEERCLAHVAFTRARHNLFVTFTKKRGGKNSGASQFIQEAELPVPVAESDRGGGGRKGKWGSRKSSNKSRFGVGDEFDGVDVDYGFDF